MKQTIAHGNTFGSDVILEQNVNSELFLFECSTTKSDSVKDFVTLSLFILQFSLQDNITMKASFKALVIYKAVFTLVDEISQQRLLHNWTN